ncbi:DUF4402 domain-containing protein, partial [Phenylobacterium sp.]|uniref:DUF4402 domain-containing protein n=1 Tax=Phenylobacterium sp. TaxID=1871053 RepID=UPI003983C1FB
VVGSAAFAQVATAPSDAVVLAPLSITANATTLSFGRIIRSSVASTTNTISVDTAGARTITGAGNGAAAPGGTVGRAIFAVTGTDNNGITIAAPSFNLTRGGGTETLPVTPSFTATANLVSGTVNVPVGGSITIADTTVAGTYTGTLSVTFAYQ